MPLESPDSLYPFFDRNSMLIIIIIYLYLQELSPTVGNEKPSIEVGTRLSLL